MQTRTTYPYFKLFASAFRSDTEGMTAEEIGAYIMLLCRAWMSEPVGCIAKEDDTTLARYARVPLKRWKAIKARVLSNFKAERTMFISQVLTEQWGECEEFSQHQRSRAKKGWPKKENQHGILETAATEEHTVVTDN
jgi:uncharacterized protein YdaU (DUF1376 family)